MAPVPFNRLLDRRVVEDLHEVNIVDDIDQFAAFKVFVLENQIHLVDFVHCLDELFGILHCQLLQMADHVLEGRKPLPNEV